MSLGILNNISALYAQNSLNSTQASLQNTLQQLSSGSRINSGADDAAGLAVADGLHANEAALAQSSQNATAGIGLLQTADGALSQVTNLLDRAVTLATEAANGTLTSGQVSSANHEYQNILTQIGNIGFTTNFNSTSVFSSKATNIVVTDGTSSGLNIYADTIGVLTTGSVGTTSGTGPVATKIIPITTQPLAAVGGQYTITPIDNTDTLSGQLSFTVGNGTQVDITIFSGDMTAVTTQLMTDDNFTGAGLSAAVNQAGTGLVITGPSSGADVAANSVAFTGTSLYDSAADIPMTGAVGVTASTGTAATGMLTISGFNSTGDGTLDDFGGSIILDQGGQASKTIIIPGSSRLGPVNSPFTVEHLIAQQLVGSGYSVAADTGDNFTSVIFNFIGADGASPVTINASSTFADSTKVTATAVGGPGTSATAPTAGTYVFSPLSSIEDVFGAQSRVTIGGETVNIAGTTGYNAASFINEDSVWNAARITAAFDLSSLQLTITGNSDGTALAVTPTGLTDRNLTPTALGPTALVQTRAIGAALLAGSSVISLANSGDTLSGTLNVAVTGGKTGALTIKAGTSGSALATQITNDASFKDAGITAAYSSGSNSVTLIGPTGAADSLTVTGTITNSTVGGVGAGADFTAAGVQTLSATTAAAILTTVTAAVADVAYQRGTIGANINQLTSASNIASSEQVNLTSAEESIRATNYGQAASDLSKYQILSQTGISALAQANSVQQEVLKLLQ